MIKRMQDSFQVNHLNLQSTQTPTPEAQPSPQPRPLEPQQDRVFDYRPHPQGVQPMRKKNTNAIFFILSFLVILGGIGTGFGVSKLRAKSTTVSSLTGEQQVARSSIKNGQVFGTESISDTFDETAGYLEEGGIDGEGSHKLLRPGGPSQTVYLTSSQVDLDQFVEMEIKVWGETQSGQKAGWLMDAHRIEVVNTSGKAPAGAK